MASKKGNKPKKFRPVLKFRDLNNHTVEVDFSDRGNRKPAKAGVDPITANLHAFDGGPVGPTELDLSLQPGDYKSDFANLVYHPEDNTDIVWPSAHAAEPSSTTPPAM